MSRRKLVHFAQMAEWPHVYEYPKGMQGNWAGAFAKLQPLVLEIGCGRGVYTIELAKRYPNKNFIGIDVKGSRMWHGAKTISEEGLTNAAFLRTRAEQLLDYFEQGEVAEIWVTFPDPQPRAGHAKRRLTSPRFLATYRQIMGPEGILHLKTDDHDFFEYTLELLDSLGIVPTVETHDLYADPGATDPDLLDIQTTYEKRWLAMGRTICYVRTGLPVSVEQIKALLPKRLRVVGTLESGDSEEEE